MLLKLFPLWAPCAAALGYFAPGLLAGGGSAIVPLLTVVMLCMGLTLTPADFLSVGRYRRAMLAGLVLQFTVMPLTALLIAHLCALPQHLSTGLVLVGSVAGGTASNVMTYIARGNVALSVSMTSLSTLCSVVLTPLLLTGLVGATVPVPALDMLLSLITIILLPVLAGVALNHYAHRFVTRLQPALAPLSMAVILLIIAIVVALNHERLATVGMMVVFATLAHNVAGLVLGYLGAFLLGFDRIVSRTIALEVGMQNSGLATALALKFFGPVAALPGAIFSVWLNITGSILASVCVLLDRRRGAVDAIDRS